MKRTTKDVEAPEAVVVEVGGSVDEADGKAMARQGTQAALLKPVPNSKRVNLEFSVNTWVPVLVSATGNAAAEAPSGPEPKERQILFDIAGVVEPGEMLALMGPSGSGKSSLLSLLAGRSTARVEGHVLFNGRQADKAIKRKLGFVTQDDLLFAELTVFETLYFAALLRLPRHWSREAKAERVEMVMEGLGLTRCRDTIIGGHFLRGVSGGERKRVSIGHELLTNPSVVFLDEPTSGLDSTTALKLVHTLRSLASGGRTIITSIHQPSSRLYQQIDKLMLLSEGRLMFYGDAHAAAHWVGVCGAALPFGVSAADHLLDLACGDLPGRSKEESGAVQKKLLADFEGRAVGRSRHGVRMADVQGKEAGSGAALTGSSSRDSDLAAAADGQQGKAGALAAVAAADGQQEEEEAAEDKWGASWTDQVQVLVTRCLRTRRLSSLSTQRYCEVIAVALLAGCFWFQLPKGASDDEGVITKLGVTDVSGLLFFQVLFMSFSTMFQALFNFPQDFAMLIKERQSGMYRLSAYYTARSVSDIPMDCALPTLFCIIIYFMSGLRLSAGAFFCNWWSMLLTLLVAQSVGLLLGATMMNMKTALASATVFMLCTMLVGGFYVRHIPIWIRWLKYASFIYYGYDLLLKIEFNRRGYSCADYYVDHPDAQPGKSWCSVSEGGIFTVDVDENVALEVCVLIGMLIVVRTATYIALKHKTSFKGKGSGAGPTTPLLRRLLPCL